MGDGLFSTGEAYEPEAYEEIGGGEAFYISSIDIGRSIMSDTEFTTFTLDVNGKLLINNLQSIYNNHRHSPEIQVDILHQIIDLLKDEIIEKYCC